MEGRKIWLLGTAKWHLADRTARTMRTMGNKMEQTIHQEATTLSSHQNLYKQTQKLKNAIQGVKPYNPQKPRWRPKTVGKQMIHMHVRERCLVRMYEVGCLNEKEFGKQGKLRTNYSRLRHSHWSRTRKRGVWTSNDGNRNRNTRKRQIMEWIADADWQRHM